MGGPPGGGDRQRPTDFAIWMAASPTLLLTAGDLDAVDVPTASGQEVPLAQVAHIEPVCQPAAVKHRNGQRVVTVSAQLVAGLLLAVLQCDLQTRVLSDDVAVSLGGDAEGVGEANQTLLGRMLIGLLVSWASCWRSSIPSTARPSSW